MAIDKLNKTFVSGEVLEAADLNKIRDKVNEVVENANSGGGNEVEVSDTEPTDPRTEIWVDTSITKATLPKEVSIIDSVGESTKDVMSQNAVSKELEKKATYDYVNMLFTEEALLDKLSFHVDINESSSLGSSRVDHGGNEKVRQELEDSVSGIILANDGRFVYLNKDDNRYTEYGDYILDENGSLKPEYEHLDMMNIVPRIYSKVKKTPLADREIDRLHVSLVSTPNSSEIPQLVVGKFKANVKDGVLRSIPNVVPSSNVNIRGFWDYAQKRGSDFGLADDDFDMFMLVHMMSKYGYRDSQNCKTQDGTPVWGVGLDGTESKTDGWGNQNGIKTGVTLSLGTNDGKSDVLDKSGNTCHSVSVLGFENPWGQYWEYRQGMCSVKNDVYLWRENWVPPISPAPTAETFVGHKCQIVQRHLASLGGPQAIAMVPSGDFQGFHLIPSAAKGGISYGDYYWYSEGSQLWLRSGRSSDGSSCGLAYSGSYYAWSLAYSYISARLAFKGKLKHVTKEEILRQ